jgi:hypothetical protein
METNFHSFSVEEANKHGLEAAILLNSLRFWLRKNKANRKNIHEGKVWTYNTISAFNELFPYISPSSIWRRLDELEKNNIIFKGKFNKDKRDNTGWFCINEPEFTELSNLTNSDFQNETHVFQNEKLAFQNETTLPVTIPLTVPVTKESPKSPFLNPENSPHAWGQGEFLNEEFVLSKENPKNVIENLPPKKFDLNFSNLEKAFQYPLVIELPKKQMKIVIKPARTDWKETEKQSAIKIAYRLQELKVPLLENYLTYLKFYI